MSKEGKTRLLTLIQDMGGIAWWYDIVTAATREGITRSTTTAGKFLSDLYKEGRVLRPKNKLYALPGHEEQAPPPAPSVPRPVPVKRTGVVSTVIATRPLPTSHAPFRVLTSSEQLAIMNLSEGKRSVIGSDCHRVVNPMAHVLRVVPVQDEAEALLERLRVHGHLTHTQGTTAGDPEVPFSGTYTIAGIDRLLELPLIEEPVAVEELLAAIQDIDSGLVVACADQRHLRGMLTALEARIGAQEAKKRALVSSRRQLLDATIAAARLLAANEAGREVRPSGDAREADDNSGVAAPDGQTYGQTGGGEVPSGLTMFTRARDIGR